MLQSLSFRRIDSGDRFQTVAAPAGSGWSYFLSSSPGRPWLDSAWGLQSSAPRTCSVHGSWTNGRHLVPPNVSFGILGRIAARILEDSRIKSWTHLHKCDERAYQCERQRKAEKLFQIEREQRSLTSNCKMWFTIGFWKQKIGIKGNISQLAELEYGLYIRK